MYIDPANRQFGAWRLDDQATSSPAKFSLFIPDRFKDPQQYEEKPGNADYGEPRIKSIHVRGDFQTCLGQKNVMCSVQNSTLQYSMTTSDLVAPFSN